MATKMTVLWLDDLDGSTATELVRFTLDGTSYEIDLNTRHAAALRRKLAPYAEAGRRTITRQPQARPDAARMDRIAATAEVTTETPTARVVA